MYAPTTIRTEREKRGTGCAPFMASALAGNHLGILENTASYPFLAPPTF